MTRANRRPLSRQQGGFSLIDVLLALGVVILISGITLTGIRRTNESNQAKAVGEQMKLVGTALNTYISLRYESLQAHVPGTNDVGDPGTAADPGPRTCTCSTSAPGDTTCTASGSIRMCTITSETLRRNGLLPNNFSGYNAFGSTYQFRIRMEGTGTVPNIDGMVWTDDAYTLEGEERFDLLGQAMMVAGADSGMTRSTLTRVEGFNGAWSEENMGVSKLGVLAYRVGYKSFGYAGYLRLSGTGNNGAMTGDINMGANQIYNVSALKATDMASDRLLMEQNKQGLVFVPTGTYNKSDDTALPGTAPAGSPSIVGDDNGGSPRLVLRSDAPVDIQTTAGLPGQLTAQDINAAGNLTGNVITGTTNIASQGTITATSTITAGGQIRSGAQLIAGAGGASGNTYIFGGSNGGIYFNADTTGTVAPGIRLGLTANTLELTNNANLTTQGNITAANLQANNAVTVGNTSNAQIFIDSNLRPAQGTTGAAQGATCTVPGRVGTLARSTSGDLVMCVNDGYWRTMGTSSNSIVQVTGVQACTGNGTAGNVVDIDCPTGSLIISGGYSWPGGASNAPRAAPIVNFRQDINTWRVQAGATQAYSDSGATANVQSCFNTYALCAR